MCYSCFNSYSSPGYMGLPKVAPTPKEPVVINCDLDLAEVRHLSVVIENKFIKEKKSELIPIIKEVREYVEGFYTTDICAKLNRINELKSLYL